MSDNELNIRIVKEKEVQKTDQNFKDMCQELEMRMTKGGLTTKEVIKVR